MNMYMLLKVILQWGKICGSKVYDVWYRFDFCVTDDVRDQVKKGGNGKFSQLFDQILWFSRHDSDTLNTKSTTS